MFVGHSPENAALVEAEPPVVALLVELVKALKPRYMIETGCYHGTTTAALARANPTNLLDTMDIDAWSVNKTREAVAGHLFVRVHECSSLDFIPEHPVEFMFLDSDAGDIRRKELDHYGPYLAPNAVVALHDSRYLPWAVGPYPGWRWITLGTPQGLTLLQKED